MKVAMTLTGAKSISEITQDSLVQGLGKGVACGTGSDGERECGIVGGEGKGRTNHQFSAILPPH